MNKTISNFKKVIEQHLVEKAANDPEFAAKYNNPDKSLDDCCKYIINEVKQSGEEGFPDQDIYNMAYHYYNNAEVDPGPEVDVKIVVNKPIELTDEEKEQIKKEAMDRLVVEEMNKLKAKKPTITPVAKTEQPVQTNTLF